MAFLELKYHSDALGMGVSVNVVLPEKAKTLIGMNANGASSPTYKTLYLLHGLSDDHSIWMRRTSIERYAADYGIAVVMPSVARSWYTDTAYGMKYLTFVSCELPAVCQSYFRGMSARREDNLVAGLSMGGYGAVKVALTRPDLFGYCASFSGVLDVVNMWEPSLWREGRFIFGCDLTGFSDLAGTKHDLFALATRMKDSNIPFPELYLWCGESDSLLGNNRKFHEHLLSLGVEHTYAESPGNHSWPYWDEQIQKTLRLFLGKDKA